MMKLLRLAKEGFNERNISNALQIIGFNDTLPTNEQFQLLNEIVNYLGFNNGTEKKEKFFDFFHDIKYYYYDFKKLRIDLLRDEITWWEFNSLLHGILLDNNSAISRIISFRTYEKPPKNYKTQEEKQHKLSMQRKREYALPDEGEVEDNFERMWNYLQTKKKGVATPNE